MSKILHYVFDPLCGWCYGASPTVAALADHPAFRLELSPSGLFADEGARPTNDEFAAYAWSNDQRIARLTGQPFSERYRQQVLGDRQQAFDSGAATLALTAVALTEPSREVAALKAIQQARYVDARDVTRRESLAVLLSEAGMTLAAARLSQPDAALLAATQARIRQTRGVMSALGVHGVPTFIIEEGGRHQLVRSDAVYSDPQAFIKQLLSA
ncbi:DsbA family protein [Dickeya fangzhongdai]|uniref:Protein-disulfide isomerase n=1 Tax=Dickeya fangzhongdai TaxID=1778540 RepID=A0A2K8QM95_9GAMM|nr:DsbA family protein [Dickeya fangzhongdai]ATZ94138.1 protein-disulfide isomerase [Dickeya fangzhongdai]QOH47573.1 DsbA family protein [Dickeya fangzhongdai]QOH51879.1 DsbA family protein [Dickeya fangzhongdai]WOY00925.1 DsbA family protein [Dickeya fangzhongdai]WOY03923.1 DsbA family protein [Dickeya fangzhongdai]